MSDTVTLDKNALAMLVDYALVKIWDFDVNDPEKPKCCPDCCGPCNAIRTLLDAGQLDDIVRERMAGNSLIWDDKRDQVDRALLDRVWRMEECHSLIVVDVGDVEYVANVRRAEDRTFWAQVEGMSNCFATGCTTDELREALAEAIRMCTT